MDQLRALRASYERRLAIFEGLKKDVKAHERQDQRAVERALREMQKQAPGQATSTEQSSAHTGGPSADAPKDAEEPEEDDDEIRGAVDRRIHNKKGTTPTQRIQWAIRIIERDKNLADSLIEETSRAMQAVSRGGGMKLARTSLTLSKTVFPASLHRTERAANPQ